MVRTEDLEEVTRNLDRIDIPEYVTWYELGERAVVIDRRDGTRLQLNASGAFLWKLVARLGSKRALIEQLEATYEVTAEGAAHGVDEWVCQLRNKQLVYPLYPDSEH